MNSEAGGHSVSFVRAAVAFDQFFWTRKGLSLCERVAVDALLRPREREVMNRGRSQRLPICPLQPPTFLRSLK